MARQQLGVAPAIPFDAATKGYADQKMYYRGTWNASLPYSANDVVLYNGASYVCTADTPALLGASVLGAGQASNTAAKTTTTSVSLPPGCASGDLAVITLGLVPGVNTTTAGLTVPSYATTRQLASAANNTYTSSYHLHYVGTYTLTTADVTAGALVIPAQTYSSNTSTTSLAAAVVVLRGVSVAPDRSQLGTNQATSVNTGSSIPVPVPAVASTSGYFEVAVVTAGASTVTALQAASGMSFDATVRQSNGRGGMFVGYSKINGVTSISTGTETLTFTATSAFTGIASVQTFPLTTTVPVLPMASFAQLGSSTPAGTMQMWAGSAASVPSGWVLCDGTSYPTTGAYAALYAAISTTYGSSTGFFAVPDMRTRVPVGQDTRDTVFATLGSTGGSKSHTHSVTTTIPGHQHPLSNANGQAALSWSAAGAIQMMRSSVTSKNINVTSAANDVGLGASNGTAVYSVGLQGTTDSTSDTTSTATTTSATTDVNSLQPYLVVNYIIKL